MSLLVEVRFAAAATRDRVVRGGIDSWHKGAIYRESWAPGCWIKRETPPSFQLEHDGAIVGEVGPIVTHGGFHVADCILEDTPVVRELVKPGAKVSLQARSLRRYEDPDLRLLHHELAMLEHIALVPPGQRAGHLDSATIVTRVRELKAKPADPFAGLPRDWAATLKRAGVTPVAGEELLEGTRVVYRYDGEKFIAAR